MSTETTTVNGRKPIRIWVDGCFDLMHYGHANALRQAKEMGDFLVVGVHSDAEIEKNKGPTVMKEDERYAAVAACKWADLVVPDAPYLTTVEMLDKYNCDYCVHGDDITTMADGSDCYQAVKDAGRYWECKRTQGVSTTEMVGRMLLMNKDHLRRPSLSGGDGGPEAIASVSFIDSFNLENWLIVVSMRFVYYCFPYCFLFFTPHFRYSTMMLFLSSFASRITLFRNELRDEKKGFSSSRPASSISHFLPTSRKIVQFSTGREPKPNDKVVYVDGAFDLFHIGHIEFLKAAKEHGDYLLVGIHDDASVNAIRGSNYPIMNVYERALSVLACKYVDEVIIGAPYSVTKDVLESVCKVSVVAHGTTECEPDIDGSDPYRLPKELGIYREVASTRGDVTTESIIERIMLNRNCRGYFFCCICEE
ncbi:hypothetical protein BC829DRAFT_368759 [Chytridium lagenaria]|nr:hypothetical protein BC829DRAFT_368759 [Chytridium lagenaria]